jgi:hypothetical protein
MKFLQKLKRFKTKQGRFPDDGQAGIGLTELQRMPKQSHLSCPSCQCPWFGISGSGLDTRTGCKNCGWESIIKLPITNKDFAGTCPSCGTPWFAIIKFGNKLAVGCQKCKWETVMPITKLSPSGLILPN